MWHLARWVVCLFFPCNQIIGDNHISWTLSIIIYEVWRAQFDPLDFWQVLEGKCVLSVWPSETWGRTIGVLIIVIQFFIPLFVILYCYANILWILSSSLELNLSHTGSQFHKQKNNVIVHRMQVARRNTVKTLFIVACCFVMCWSQNQTIYFMFNLGYNLNWNSVYFNFTIFMVFLNCTVNPFIYWACYNDFQRALKNLMPCRNQHNNVPGSSTDVNSISELPSTQGEPSLQSIAEGTSGKQVWTWKSNFGWKVKRLIIKHKFWSIRSREHLQFQQCGACEVLCHLSLLQRQCWSKCVNNMSGQQWLYRL